MPKGQYVRKKKEDEAPSGIVSSGYTYESQAVAAKPKPSEKKEEKEADGVLKIGTVESDQKAPKTVCFRTKSASLAIPVTTLAGKTKIFKAKNHRLILDPNDKFELSLIEHMRAHRSHGGSWKEVVPGQEDSNLSEQADSLQQAFNMNVQQIWAYFTPAEVAEYNLDSGSNKAELLAAFAQLRKIV